MPERWKRPSEIFATRLRETREARGGKSQGEVAKMMRDEGRPMSKGAVLRLEKEKPEPGEGRVLSLDEAIAFAAVLNVSPAHLLSPRGDEKVGLTDKRAVDSAGLRAWLLHGYEFVATGSEYQRGERAKELERVVLAHAQAFVDAARGDDEAGKLDALKALGRTAILYRDQIEQIEQTGGAIRIVTEEEQ
jgi:transcriptional regulator with XRE-family HTH domain